MEESCTIYILIENHATENINFIWRSTGQDCNQSDSYLKLKWIELLLHIR